MERQRARQRHQRHRLGQHPPLTSHRRGDRRRELSGEWPQEPREWRAAADEDEVGDAIGQQAQADPAEHRSQQRVPVDRHLRDALGDKDEVVAVLGRLPEHERRGGQRGEVQAVARPPRCSVAAADLRALTGDGQRAGVAPCRQRDRSGRDQQPGERGAAGPQRGGERRGAEAGGSEGRRADEQRSRQADRHAGAATEHGFAERDADELAGRGAAGAQQRGVPAAAVRARRGDRGGHQASEDRAGDAEEQEQQLGVERVLAGTVQGGAEVVADQAAAGEPCLEVARVARDLRERGVGAGGQLV